MEPRGWTCTVCGYGVLVFQGYADAQRHPLARDRNRPMTLVCGTCRAEVVVTVYRLEDRRYRPNWDRGEGWNQGSVRVPRF